MSKPYWKTAMAGALALGLTAAAQAGNLSAQTRSGNYHFLQGTNDYVPLTNNGTDQSFRFKLGNPIQVKIDYRAECAVTSAADNHTTWVQVNLDVFNDDTGAFVATAAPTVGTSDAFCTSNGTVGDDGWMSTAVQGVIALGVGNYRVKVRASVVNGVAGNQGHLGDSSLVITKN